ncbi:hypothetical protein IJ182_06830 [bacterium]|nr:hypothetical protein [bacterium]
MKINNVELFNTKISNAKTIKEVADATPKKNDKSKTGKKLAIALCGLAAIGAAAVSVAKIKQGKAPDGASSQMAQENLERLKRLAAEEAKYKTKVAELQQQSDKLMQRALDLIK